jgi:hypothetical protein
MKEGNQDHRAWKDWMQCMLNSTITEIGIIMQIMVLIATTATKTINMK